ncbi:MAG: hypothetical protein ACE5JK_01690 [Candidatus Omnitrophota bacterium]
MKYLKEDGVIIIHDCNPPNETIGFPAKSIKHVGSLNLPGWTGLWTGDVWKTIVYLRSIHRDLNVFVLNCDMGVAIITKRKPENMLEYTLEDIENLSYKDLERSRERLLNLKNPQYFKEFIKSL